ncbi:FAD-binding oxidoreductase [Isoalcanivorax pacificus W11-5]|uniref:FAD-binding oxidoreductase n=1 Tax=Isoalcanivorax pacificus W11-5 TaxID=391936 RepID=A0A0B4XK61_9GAMM|nr:FAD-binding oxidoreductase [Isoalcanivorax pacificus W11-5]
MRLSEQGCKPLILDAPVSAPPASWAGGGILSALFPWRYSDALTALTREARHAYERLSAQVIDAGGADLQVEPCGMLVISVPDAAAARAWGERHRIFLGEVAGDSIVPDLSGETAVWMPQVANVRNPLILTGVRYLLAARGIVPQAAAVEHMRRISQGWQIQAGGTVLQARQVLIAAGSWSARILSLLGVEVPVLPVKGEMLLYPATVPAPPCIILSSKGYVIPRRDGQMLVGSTLSEGEWDQRPSEAAYTTLREAAPNIWPALAEVVPVAHWAGLRPGSPRDIPWIGEVPAQQGLFLATGHYRNGLVSAPATADLVVALMRGEQPQIDPAPYSFSSSSPP